MTFRLLLSLPGQTHLFLPLLISFLFFLVRKKRQECSNKSIESSLHHTSYFFLFVLIQFLFVFVEIICICINKQERRAAPYTLTFFDTIFRERLYTILSQNIERNTKQLRKQTIQNTIRLSYLAYGFVLLHRVICNARKRL